jgi:hypothetical protein
VHFIDLRPSQIGASVSSEFPFLYFFVALHANVISVEVVTRRVMEGVKLVCLTVKLGLNCQPQTDFFMICIFSSYAYLCN